MGFGDFLVNLVPTSAVDAFAKGEILQVLVFSVLFACGLASLGDRAQPVLDIVERVSQALFWIIRQVMKIAPIAAFGVDRLHGVEVRPRLAGPARRADRRIPT